MRNSDSGKHATGSGHKHRSTRKPEIVEPIREVTGPEFTDVWDSKPVASGSFGAVYVSILMIPYMLKLNHNMSA